MLLLLAATPEPTVSGDAQAGQEATPVFIVNHL